MKSTPLDFPAELDPRKIPTHVAIIMDGNGRWAERRGLPRVLGHREGLKAVRKVVEACRELNVPVLTLYTFSVENWQRPKREVRALMGFLREKLLSERDELKENGVRLRILGRMGDLPKEVREVLDETIDYLADGGKLILNLALSYGGRSEIVDSVRRILAEHPRITSDEVNESLIESHLYTAGLPDPDLVIRTGGEFRISNFLLWQAAYAELWVTKVLWPDFKKRHLVAALKDYQERERRFGRVR